MKTSLAKIFNETATAVHKDYPAELKDLVILLLPASDTPVYVSPGIADQLTKSIAGIKDSIRKLAVGMRARNAVGLADKNFHLAGTPVNLIALTKDVKGIFSSRYTAEMRIIFNLDHEIGHHILKNGYPAENGNMSFRRSTRQLAESVADAFAMLRHIQRFGKDTDQAGFYAESRAYPIVLAGDTEHYTTNTVHKTLEIAAKTDITRLSLRETVALAEKIALQTCLDDETLTKIYGAFAPVVAACKAEIGSAFDISEKFYNEDKDAYMLFCRGALAVMIKHMNDADIFNAGKQFLSYPAIRDFMKKQALTDPAWGKALEFINSHTPESRSTPRKDIRPAP